MRSANSKLWNYVLSAMRQWKPEKIEGLAHAMRRYAQHPFPEKSEAWRRMTLIYNKGNVADALKVRMAHYPSLDKDNERRSLQRLKKILFPDS